MSNYNSITEFTNQLSLDREGVINKCIYNYASHIGQSVEQLASSHEVQYFPSGIKLINPEGVVIFEVRDPDFAFSPDDYNAKSVNTTFRYKEFWKYE